MEILERKLALNLVANNDILNTIILINRSILDGKHNSHFELNVK